MPSLGNQTPTYSWCASYNRSEGKLAAALSDAYALSPHPWQRTVLGDWLALDDDGKLLNSVCLLPVPRQNGKALALDTEIPTTDGWKAMADIHVGDYVFGQDGKASRVTLESEVFHKPMYRVTFDDGATVDASEDHVWTVQTHDSIDTCRRKSKTEARTYARKHEYHGDGWFELTTKDMVGDYAKHRTDGRIEYRYRVPMNGAVEYPERDLPVHPYLLGAWLGDGTSKNATITVSEDDIPETTRIFAECGETLTRQKTIDRAPCFRIGRKTRGRYDSGSFYARLKSLGVIGNKHIPEPYMVASVEQRWSLLQGLMDTDGYCSKAGQCEFVQKRRDLCLQVLELCASLGIKARMHEKQATCNGRSAGTVYRVTFFTDSAHPCFRMERKRARLKDGIASRTAYKAIASIERMDDVPSKCIAIDNESHLYLAGRQYTATHNTGVCDPRETWGLIHRGEWILHTAQEFQTSQKAFDRLREKFGKCKNDPNAKYPELNRLVAKYTTSANQMVLDLTNGGHIEFRTRGSGGDTGRGGTFDLIVVDEAQSYSEESDAALSPLNSAAPHGSPQTIYMGTVPDPTKPHKGEVFARLRNDAHAEPYEGMCIHEWAAPEVGDPKDVGRWYEYNPSLGYQLLERALLKDARSMAADTFAREHLGHWSMMEVFARVIGESAWAACQTDCPPESGLVCYGVKFSPDGRRVALSVALRPSEGPTHLEVVRVEDMAAGMQWLVDWLVERMPRAAQVAIDGQSNAQELNDRLLSARVPRAAIMRPSSGDVVAACSMLVTAVSECTVTHFGQEALTASATKTTRRRIGSRGGWGFGSTDEGDATLVESAALAHWAARTTRRDPNRKSRAGC